MSHPVLLLVFGIAILQCSLESSNKKNTLIFFCDCHFCACKVGQRILLTSLNLQSKSVLLRQCYAISQHESTTSSYERWKHATNRSKFVDPVQRANLEWHPFSHTSFIFTSSLSHLQYFRLMIRIDDETRCNLRR